MKRTVNQTLNKLRRRLRNPVAYGFWLPYIGSLVPAIWLMKKFQYEEWWPGVGLVQLAIFVIVLLVRDKVWP